MAHFIHIDEEDGMVFVRKGQTTGWRGWIYKVPNNYVLTLRPDDLKGHSSIDSLLNNDERAVMVYTSG